MSIGNLLSRPSIDTLLALSTLDLLILVSFVLALVGTLAAGLFYSLRGPVYISATGNSNTAAFYNHDDSSGGKHCSNVKIVNNVFYTTGGAKILNIKAEMLDDGARLRLEVELPPAASDEAAT